MTAAGKVGVEPGGAALLRQARADYLSEILPHVPKDKRYLALMIANAMGIASRGDAEAEAAVRDGLARVLGGEVGLEEGLVRLAAALRAGELDDRPEVRDLLRTLARARLAVSNPKALPPA